MTLTIELSPDKEAVLQTAAIATHLSLGEFMIESALSRAQETLPDRQRFGLDAQQWEAFQAALASPPRPAARLARLFSEPSVFERGNS